jgi:hypothetical protein
MVQVSVQLAGCIGRTATSIKVDGSTRRLWWLFKDDPPDFQWTFAFQLERVASRKQ